MGDRFQRPRLVPHSVCFRQRRPLFHGRRQHPPPGFDELTADAHLQELFGLPSMFAWTLGPTLPMEPVPYYYVQWPYPVFPMLPLLPPWMVPAIPYEVVKRRRSQPPAEQGTEAVRPQATRTQTRKSATSSKSATSRSSQSNEEEDEYIELVLWRLLRAVGDLGLNVPAKEEEPRCAAHKFIYSAATPRSLNVHSRASTPASRLEHRD
ncbi:hypothetical protein HPB51_027082 [Rhipicephalus microplus]|uniref:Uncharacterized protein n=1 Tax=Rhipicephalus microplus TaxID=6941 RepID=A0A9J6D156_RHIMP|nr:hypothetical protein HPB51_027082 [Rhipicephalus microplus]